MKFGWRESVVDEAIGDVLTQMNTYGVETLEYREAMDYLDRLMKMKAEERRFKVTPDTIAIIAGNLVGILIIVGYERGHVMTSKVMGFVIKPKD
jgi:hypothetical protein